eukprot:85990_1
MAKMNNFQAEIKQLTWLAMPLIGMYSFTFSFRVLTIIFVGQYLTTAAFDSLALGQTVTNITGYSMIIAFISPMDSLCTQAYGAKNWTLYSITVHRAILCASAYSIPIVIIWYFIYDILIASGYDQIIAYNAWLFAMINISAIPSIITSCVCNRFLSCQNIAKPMLYIAFITYIIWHPLSLYFIFTYLGKRHFVWAPICNVITLFLNALCLVSYCTLAKPHHTLSIQNISISNTLQWQTNSKQDALIEMDHEHHVIDKGLKEYIELSIGGILSLCAEWWSFELLTFLAGMLGQTQLAVHAIYATYLPLYYMIPLGLSIASAARVGTLIGEKRPMMAKRVSVWVLWFMTVFSIALGALSWILRRYLPLLFSRDSEIIDIAIKLNPLFCGMVIVDAIQGVFQGVLRGMKQQTKSAIGVLIGPWIITVPLSAWLAFDKHIDLKVFGIWTGNNVGYLVLDMIFVYIFVSYGWNESNSTDPKEQKTKDSCNVTMHSGMFVSHFSAFASMTKYRTLSKEL